MRTVLVAATLHCPRHDAPRARHARSHTHTHTHTHTHPPTHFTHSPTTHTRRQHTAQINMPGSAAGKRESEHVRTARTFAAVRCTGLPGLQGRHSCVCQCGSRPV